ncbi:septum site-determining protein MinC, partial [Pseudomonas syringae]
MGFRQNKGRAFYNGSCRLWLAGVLAIRLGTFSDKLLCISTMSQIESQNPEPVFQLKGSM